MWLIYPAYTFSYIIIILIYRKIYFHLSTIDKKKLITKYSTFPLFTRDWFCRFITSAVPSPTSHSLIIHNADHSWRSYLSSTTRSYLGTSTTILIELGYLRSWSKYDKNVINLLYIIYIRKMKSNLINIFFYSSKLEKVIFFLIKEFFLKRKKSPGFLVRCRSAGHSVRDI